MGINIGPAPKRPKLPPNLVPVYEIGVDPPVWYRDTVTNKVVNISGDHEYLFGWTDDPFEKYDKYDRRRCEWCRGTTKDDYIGNCAACGAPRG